jgi:uncharacterized membrane protein (GlpM family)
MSPADYFWLSLLLKAALTATIIVTASLIVERGGPFLGAMIASLPTSVGAAYIILSLDHTPDFISNSAVGSLAGNSAGVTFAAVYALLARRHSLIVSLGSALLVWFAAACLLRFVDWSIWGAIILNAIVVTITISLTAPVRAASVSKPETTPSVYDIPVRAALVSLFVILVTTVSHSIGPFASGLFAVFPMAMSSFIVILHIRIGGKATSNVIAHAQVPMLGLILVFVIVHFLALVTGVWWALGLGLLGSLAWNAFLWIRRTRFVPGMALE